MPNVNQITMMPNFQTPGQYASLVQTITQYADVTLAPIAPSTTVIGSQLPTTMSPTNPLTIVVNGDLDLLSWHHSGYGLLLVTGNLNYDPDASWYGIVLVIGKGTMTGSRSGSGEFDGTFLLVQTLDPSTGYTTLLPSLGQSRMSFAPTMGSIGIYYSTCWIQNALPTSGYKVLSFHEISQ